MFQSSARLAALPSLGLFACGGGRLHRFFRRLRRGRGVVLSGRLGGGGGGGGGESGSGGGGGGGGLEVVGAVGWSVFGQGCSLGDELADQGTSSSAGSQEDLLVEIGERVVELSALSEIRQGAWN
jgi:hypothetical protein